MAVLPLYNYVCVCLRLSSCLSVSACACVYMCMRTTGASVSYEFIKITVLCVQRMVYTDNHTRNGKNIASLTADLPGGHLCWSGGEHLHPLLLSQPRTGQEDQFPLPAHVGLCWSPRSYCLCTGHTQHQVVLQAADIHHHHPLYRHGNCVCMWRAHHSGASVPQNTASLLAHIVVVVVYTRLHLFFVVIVVVVYTQLHLFVVVVIVKSTWLHLFIVVVYTRLHLSFTEWEWRTMMSSVRR